MSGGRTPEPPSPELLVCLTRGDLRDELQTFACRVIEPHLSELAARMQKDLREQLRQYAPEPGGLLGEDPPAAAQGGSATQDLDDLDKRLTLRRVADELMRKDLHRKLEKKPSTLLMTNAVCQELEDGGYDITPVPSLKPRAAFTSTTRETMLPPTPRGGAKKIPAPPGTGDDPEAALDPSRTGHKPDIAGRVVRHLWFERVVMIVIVLNAIYIGVATDIMATRVYSDTPMELRVFEYVFLSVFILELGLRFWVHGCSLFRMQQADGKTNPSVYWNILDCTVIVLQLIEIAPWGLQTASIDRISVIRTLRLIRLVRIIRVIKIFRFVRDLRMIVYAIGRSLSLFLWAIVALALMNYTASVMFTEMALSHRIKFSADGADTSEIEKYFGTLTVTMLSMFQAVTGGMDWGVLTDCFRTGDVDSTVVIFCLVAYVAFTQIALLNVITGVFLDTAMDSARDERDAYVVRNARVIFQAADHNKDGTITWPDFERSLDHPDVQNFFEAVDIHVSEAKALFDLLDGYGDGNISADEFLNGCLRVRGPSKALDLLVLSRDMGMMLESYAANTEALRQKSGVSARPDGGPASPRASGAGTPAKMSAQRTRDAAARAFPRRKSGEAPPETQPADGFGSIRAAPFDPVVPAGADGESPGEGAGTLSLPGMCSAEGPS